MQQSVAKLPARALALVALAAAAVVLTAAAIRAARSPTPSSALAWAGLVGEPRAEVDPGQRMLVVLNAPSLADRVAAAGGKATDAEERRWTQRALGAQRLFISTMGIQGVRIEPEFTYARVLNGFSAPLDPGSIALLERAPEVEGIYPVRAAFPAAVSSTLLGGRTFATGSGRRVDVRLPGFDGRGVTVALLDTGVDRAHPYLGGRVLDGIDVLGGSPLARAAPNPDDASELERHGTQLAGILLGADGPGGLAGVATGATLLPVRVAGWQRDARGEWAVYSRTDQIVAGLERAVDPNADGDAHDAARVALPGVVEPYAAFAQGPLAKASAGALALDTLVVAPVGNEGPAGPGFGTVSGPGGAPAVLTVGASDLVRRHEHVRVVLRAGLQVIADRRYPLAGLVAPERAITLAAGRPRLFAPGAAPAEQAASLTLADFFDEGGFSRVAGRAALVPAGKDIVRTVRAAARAGAAAVIAYGGPVPEGSLGLDERVPIPVVSVPAAVAHPLLDALERGASAGVSIGLASPVRSTSGRRVAGFSSHGLAFDGRVKPELTGPGVALATSEPGANDDGSARFGTINGSSAAAAVVAGAAAVLAQARPELDAAALKSLLVGAASPTRAASVVAEGAGLLDLAAASTAELATRPAALALGRATGTGWRQRRRVIVRNLSTRTLILRIAVERRGFPAADAIVSAEPSRLILRPGGSARIRVSARVSRPALGGPAAEGALVLTPAGGTRTRVPFAIAFGGSGTSLLGAADLSQRTFRPSDTRPAVLSLQAGFVRTIGGVVEVEPVRRLDVELWTGDRKRIGLIARLRNVLPGRYAFGITGRDPAGQVLEPGAYRLRLVAYPTSGGRASTRSLQFAIK